MSSTSRPVSHLRLVQPVASAPVPQIQRHIPAIDPAPELRTVTDVSPGTDLSTCPSSTPTSASIPTPADSRTVDDLRLAHVSDREWTVRDTRIPSDDSRSLLGFIETNHGRYDVMKFGDPMEFCSFASLDGAFRSFERETAPDRGIVRTDEADAVVLPLGFLRRTPAAAPRRRARRTG